MLQITVNLYGQLKELCANSLISLSLSEHSHKEDLLDLLEKQFPGFQKLRKYVMCAVNDEFIDTSYEFKNDDRVDILPPASGG